MQLMTAYHQNFTLRNLRKNSTIYCFRVPKVFVFNANYLQDFRMYKIDLKLLDFNTTPAVRMIRHFRCAASRGIL